MMRRIWKTGLLLLLSLAMIGGLTCDALAAEFSARWTAMPDRGIECLLSAHVEQWDPLSATSLAIVNDWLREHQLRLRYGSSYLSGEPDSQMMYAGLEKVTQERVFDVTLLPQSEGILSVFSSGRAYLTGPAEKDALALLADSAALFPDVSALPRVYQAAAAGLYAALERYVAPKTVKESTTIRNSASSTSYIDYRLRGDELNAYWPEMLEAALPAIRQNMTGQLDWYSQLEALLRSLVFSGDCRMKRMLDKNGADMGLQFTGQASRYGEDARTVTLFGGYTDGRGGYISLNLPSVKGQNSFKGALSASLTAQEGIHTLTIEGEYRRTYNSETESAEWNITLKNTEKRDGTETWGGRGTITTRKDSTLATWTLTPDLKFTDDGLEGTVTVQKKDVSKVRTKATVQLKMTPADTAAFSVPLQEVTDLRGMYEEQARAYVLAELPALSSALVRILAELPEEVRALLTHDLRTEEWMTGPGAVQVPLPTQTPIIVISQTDTADENPWIVEEDQE